MPPGFQILTLFQIKKKFISHTLLDSHITLSFCIHLELKRQLRSYNPVVPSKTMPDSRPKWAMSIPVFRPKGCENYSCGQCFSCHIICFLLKFCCLFCFVSIVFWSIPKKGKKMEKGG